LYITLNGNRFSAAAVCAEELAKLEVTGLEDFPGEDLDSRAPARFEFWAQTLRGMEKITQWPRVANRWPKPPLGLSQYGDLAQKVADNLDSPGSEAAFVVAPDHETPDAVAIHLIHVRGIQLAQAASLAKMPRAALPVLGHLLRISTLAKGRLGPGMPYYSEAYVNRLEDFLRLDAAILEKEGGGGMPVLQELEERRDALRELDRMVADPAGAGRSDNFERRWRALRGQ